MKTKENLANHPGVSLSNLAVRKPATTFQFQSTGLADCEIPFETMLIFARGVIQNATQLLASVLARNKKHRGTIEMAEALLFAANKKLPGISHCRLNQSTTLDRLVTLLVPIWLFRTEIVAAAGRWNQKDHASPWLVELIELIAITETFLFDQGYEVGVKTVTDPLRPTSFQKLALDWRKKLLLQGVSEVTLEIAENLPSESKGRGTGGPCSVAHRAGRLRGFAFF